MGFADTFISPTGYQPQTMFNILKPDGSWHYWGDDEARATACAAETPGAIVVPVTHLRKPAPYLQVLIDAGIPRDDWGTLHDGDAADAEHGLRRGSPVGRDAVRRPVVSDGRRRTADARIGDGIDQGLTVMSNHQTDTLPAGLLGRDPFEVGRYPTPIDVVCVHGPNWFPLQIGAGALNVTLYLRRAELRRLRDRLDAIDRAFPDVTSDPRSRSPHDL